MLAATRRALVPFTMLLVAAQLSAAPSVFPAGVTINDQTATWKGYTVLSLLGAPYAAVIDMDGKIVKTWDGFNSSAGGPVRVLPNGQVIAPSGANPGHQESLALVAQDFSGKELWRFDRNETIAQNGQQVNALRQHHDWQRADFPAGYYSPTFTPAATSKVKTLVLTHVNRVVAAVGPGMLEDDHIIELDADGKVVFEWFAGDHVDEFGFDAAAREAVSKATAPARGAGGGGGRGAGAGPAGPGARAGAGGPPPVARGAGPGAGAGAGPGAGAARGAGPGGARQGGPGAGGGAPAAARGFDWVHVNSATWIGPNKWFDAGDKRFNPENIIISTRSASFIAIIGRDGKVVWRMGPDMRETPEQLAIGQIIGQHHAHMIPKGLPGEGNIMVFDNGGSSGYGTASPIAPQGVNILARANSRVIEVDPVTMKRVWMYNGAGFFSTNISGAQRLPNGNTLITEGAGGRVFEVTPDSKIVWEFMNQNGTNGRPNTIYRAYRVPYSWIPQLPQPVAAN